MRRLEQAAHRLEKAVGRLELAVRRSKADLANEARLAAALAQAKADYTALEATTSQVAGRLDATILRLDKVLES